MLYKCCLKIITRAGTNIGSSEPLRSRVRTAHEMVICIPGDQPKDTEEA